MSQQQDKAETGRLMPCYQAMTASRSRWQALRMSDLSDLQHTGRWSSPCKLTRKSASENLGKCHKHSTGSQGSADTMLPSYDCSMQVSPSHQDLCMQVSPSHQDLCPVRPAAWSSPCKLISKAPSETLKCHNNRTRLKHPG